LTLSEDLKFLENHVLDTKGQKAQAITNEERLQDFNSSLSLKVCKMAMLIF
jgi:hypothetical protein